MRLHHPASASTRVRSGRRLQDARFPAIGAETQRAVAVVWIAVSRVPRDDDGLAVHRRRQVRGPAVVADEQVAAFEHVARLTKRHAAQNDRFATQQSVYQNCAVPEETLLILPLYPGLAPWAKLIRPCGAGSGIGSNLFAHHKLGARFLTHTLRPIYRNFTSRVLTPAQHSCKLQRLLPFVR